jgi:signal transduction histidine kinase
MRLRNKILSFTLPLTLAPFLLMAAAAVHFVVRSRDTEIREEQKTRVLETTIAIQQELEAARKHVALIAGLPAIRDSLVSPPEQGQARAVLQLFFDQNPYYLRLSLVDTRGQVRISLSRLPGDQPTTLAGEDSFRRILVMPVVQAPVQEAQPGRFATVLLRRVAGAPFAGAVVLHLSTAVFQRTLGPLRASPEVSAFLFDDSGRVFVESLAGEAEEAALRRLDLAAEAAALLARPSLRFTEKQVGSLRLAIHPAEAFERANWDPRAGENWFLGVLRRPGDLEAQTRSLQAVFAAILAAATAAVWWAARRFARRVTGPLEQVSAATAEIARGRFDVKLEGGAGDEVGELAAAVERMAEDLRDYQAKLVRSAKLATMGEMASEISHEIQNRISGLSLWIQHLDQEIGPDGPKRECLDEMKRGLRGFTDLLAGLKEVYRTPILDLRPADLNELARDSLRCIEEQAADRRIHVEAQLEAGLPAVQCDEEKMRSVIINLLTNAIEAVADGTGRVALRTRQQERARGKAVVLSVEDNGCGIAGEDLERVFYPFYSTKGSGSGLGLAIASNIVAAHQGRLSIDSRPGHGAVFHVALEA